MNEIKLRQISLLTEVTQRYETQEINMQQAVTFLYFPNLTNNFYTFTYLHLSFIEFIKSDVQPHDF